MDNSIFIYLIKVSVSIAIFYGLYMLCLRGDKFFRLRRAYFLFVLAFSFMFPAFSFEMPAETQMPVYWLSQIDDTIVDGSAVTTESADTTTISLWSVAFIIVSSVTILLILTFFMRFFSLLNLKNKSTIVEINGSKIIKINNTKVTPFSFFRWIFIPFGSNEKDIHEIIAHENEHMRQMHSIDVVVYELFCVIFWWNPFAWLMKKEMKVNLEYLADEAVLNKGFDPQEYQYALLQVSNKNTGIPIVNNFNVSQLKKRITMMNRKKTPMLMSAKYLLAVPVAALLLLGNVVQASPELADLVSKNVVTEYIESDNSAPVDLQEISIAAPKLGNDKLVVAEDQLPSFPGGVTAMTKFVQDNLKYPAVAQKKGISGRVTIRFVVSATGSIQDAEVVRGISPECDAEALRVINSMPRWNPGKENGKAVPVYSSVPVVFKLNDNDKKNEVVVIGYGKQSGDKKDEVVVVGYGKQSGDKPFITVEQMPVFPGGEEVMQKFIRENLKYPVEAQEKGAEGRVTVRFTVKTSGELTDVTVMRGIDSELNAEAVRLVKSMPKWNPGKQNGKVVPVYYTLPIVFKLAK